MTEVLYLVITVVISLITYGLYRFSTRISSNIPYAGEESLLARLRVPLEYGKDPIGFLARECKSKGDFICVDLFLTKFVFLLGSEGNRAIFNAAEDEVSFVEANVRLIGPFLPPSVLDPRYYEHMKKVIYVGFGKAEHLQGYAHLCEGLTDEFFKKWSEADSVPLFASFSEFIYAHLIVMIMGDEFYRAHGQETISLLRQLDKNIRSPILQFLPFSLWRFTSSGSRGFQAQRHLDKLFSPMMDTLLKEKLNGTIADNPSFIAYACRQLKSDLFPAAILHMPLFLFAGHANLARTIPWFVLHAQAKPGAIERCRAEIEDISTGAKDSTPFVEACFRETGRLYSLGNVIRAVPRSQPNGGGFVTIMGRKVPMGTFVSCSPATTHRDPAVFEDPECWRPDRFLKDEGEMYSRWFRRLEFVQFGYGAHSCPGEKLSYKIFIDLLLKTWLRKFDISVVSGLVENTGLDNIGAEAAWMDEPSGTPPMRGDVQVKVTPRV